MMEPHLTGLRSFSFVRYLEYRQIMMLLAQREEHSSGIVQTSDHFEAEHLGKKAL